MPDPALLADTQSVSGLEKTELLRRARQVLASRSQGGIFAYPLAGVLLGVAVGLGWQDKVYTWSIAILFGLSLARAFLIRRFGVLYDSSPRRWYSLFVSNLLGTALAWTFFVCWILATLGMGEQAMAGLIMSGLISLVAVIIFSPDLLLARVFVSCMVLPVTGVLVVLGDTISYAMGAASLVLLFYGNVLVRQLHREFWRSLLYQRLLKTRQTELSEAKDDLQSARDALRQRVMETEASLRDREADYRRIFEGAHESILMVDPESLKILQANPWASVTYGYDRAELIGLSLEAITEGVSKVRVHFEQAMQSRGLQRFEVTQFHRKGHPLLLEVNASVVEYRGQSVLLCLHRDLTEQRRAEALRLAKEAAERGSEAKGQFLANMSHEIRTPMGGILGITGLLRKTELGTKERQYVEIIEEAARGLLTLIDDILDFSKIEAGKLVFEEAVYDVHQIVEQVVQLMATTAESKGLDLSVSMDEHVPRHLIGDGRRMRQVILNLLGNAIKFTEVGHVSLNVETLRSMQARVRFTVTDTGIGIPAEVQERLFHTFTQADETMSRRFGGTGLGLAISQRLVELMGGSLGFDSEPGFGSTFWFEVPVQAATEDQVDAVESEPLKERSAQEAVAPEDSRKPSRILLAEDNEVNRLVAMAQLEALGYHADAVDNGYEAIAALGEQNYELVLMDCQMPNLDGYEATRQVRQDPRWSELPIVALTAHAMAGDREKCLEAGMNDYISKPFEEDELRQVLDRWLRG